MREQQLPKPALRRQRYHLYLFLRIILTSDCKTRKKDQELILNVLQIVRQILDNSTLIKECL